MDRRILVVWALGAGLVVTGLAAYLALPTSGTLVIQVRDAPSGFSHVYVTFSEVQVHPADAPNGSAWQRIVLAASTIDFMALGNLTTVLGVDRLTAGTYTQIRIVVATVSGTLVGGSSVPLLVPDGIVKTTTPFDVPRGGVTRVTLDFDLARSITWTSSGWTFRPVLGPVVVG